LVGVLAGTVCFVATNLTNLKLRIDDSLDVFPVQAGGVLAVIAYTGVATYAILRITDLVAGNRVPEQARPTASTSNLTTNGATSSKSASAVDPKDRRRGMVRVGWCGMVASIGHRQPVC
jgi:ammonia channel protein AmtB